MILIWAGLLAGAVHVVSGPDHLLALAPFSIQSGQSKTWIGIKWGLGHGIGIACVAIGLLFVKTQIDVVRVSEWAELMVGFVLIAVGVKALFMARKLVIHEHEHGHTSLGHEHQHSHLHVHVGQTSHPHPSTDRAHLHAPMWIGLLHGIAGTGHLFGLVPALGLGLVDAAVYLAAYVLASIGTMVVCVSCLDAVVARAGEHMMPRIMKWTASAAIVTGIVWLYNNGYSTGRLLDIGS